MNKTIVVAALRDLETTNGKLTPRRIVEAARSPSHPLHPYFEWDDAKAAQKQREDTARRMLRLRYEVRYEHVTYRIPHYIRDPEAPPHVQGYCRTEVVRTEAELAHEALVAEFARVRANLRRARHLAVRFGMEGEVEQLEAVVADLAERLQQPEAGTG